MDGLTLRRPTEHAPRDDRRAGTLPRLAVLLVTASLVATCGAAGPSPGSSGAVVSPGASGAPGQTAGPTSTSEATDWARVQLAPLARVATLSPTREAPAGASPDTAFRLTSLDGRDPAGLAARLVAEPAIELLPGRVSGDTIELTPVAPLRQGQLYRFTLRGDDPAITEAVWAVQTVKPLHVVTSIPYDESTDVPRDTGIEITFDQDGVALADARRHIDISPDVAGRFEQHGRTVVLVPDKPLRQSRLYTITVRRGLPLAGTEMRLERDVVIRFETTGKAPSRVHMSLTRSLFDASTAEQAAISMHLDTDDEEGESQAVGKASVSVHRLPGLDAAVRALDAIESAPDWTQLTTAVPMDTSGLPLVLTGKLRIDTSDYPAWIRLPKALRAGWYVVTVTLAGMPRQAVLQVSDLAAFARVTTTRTAVWVNDLRSGDPVRGAAVELSGRALGTTGAEGLLVTRTPSRIVGAADEGLDTQVVVRAGKRSLFVPLNPEACGKCWDVGAYDDGSTGDSERWWQLFTSDRSLYRTTDTVNAWGVVRNRATGEVPSSVAIELFVQDWSATRDLPVVSTTATPDRTGSFVARLPLRSLPAGSYVLRLRAGDDTVAETSLRVGSIVKPAWALALDTDRHAVISGRTVTATLGATFFEGTPVAGAELRVGAGSAYYEGDEVYFDDEGDGRTVLATTDGSGSATAKVGLQLRQGDEEEWSDGTDDQYTIQSVIARPTAPEEGDIWGGGEVAVFAASALVTTQGILDGTRLKIDGAVRDVALGRYEAPGLESLWDVDPLGAPRPGAGVRVHVVEHTTVLREAGTRYDFITKRVEPVYEAEERTRDVGTQTARTGADGSYHLSMTVTGGPRRSYSIAAAYTDEAGRITGTRTHAESSHVADAEDDTLRLETLDGESEDHPYGIGDTVRLVARGGADGASVSRFLFLVEHQGLRTATVSSGRRFSTRFEAADVPNLQISAVRFNGAGYEPSGWPFLADFRIADRQLLVELSPERTSYRPGDRATLAVRTTDLKGRPRAASVYVRVIDERLYAMAGAEDVDPLAALYAGVGSGELATAWSHHNPTMGGEGGDATGGGDGGRSDFRDWLAAELVTTGADGRGSLTVQLSDDLTSWRAVGQAVDAKLRAGIGTTPIVVNLPLFAEANIAPEYLAADRPVIRVRAYGSGLAAGDRVTFRVSSDTLPMTAVTAAARAFEPVEVPLPALSVGEHRVRIVASTGSGAAAREDILVRTFRVVETRTVQARTTWTPLASPTAVQGGPGFTTVTLVDAGRGRVVPVLESLARATPDRADRAIAAAVASDLLREAFGIEPDGSVPEPDLDRFMGSGGVGVVPWGGADLELSVLAGLSGDPRIDPGQLSGYFADPPDGDEGAEENRSEETRERALLRLAGQAALGEPVLSAIRTAARLPDLAGTERITLALAALAAGDENQAAELERGLLEQHGQRFGPLVRIHGVQGVPDAVATARVAIVAASLGDPIAADMDAFVEANPPPETTVHLERAIAARGWVARVPGAAAVAAVTIGGQRSEVAISPDRPARYTLTPEQVAGMRLEPVRGSVLVITTGEEPLDPAGLTPPAGVSVKRSVAPGTTIAATDAVVVTFTVTLGQQLDDGCWRLTDFAPSGLVPIDGRPVRSDEDDEESAPASTDEYPSRVEGQRVDFCVAPDRQRPTHTLRYLARVVTPGSYRWEPAVLQSSLAPEQGVVVAPLELSIGGLGE